MASAVRQAAVSGAAASAPALGISTGNLSENPKAHLFLIDYAQRRRVKVWGRARVVEGDAWDANRPQHIPQRFEAADVHAALAERDQRIGELEAQLQALRATAAEPNLSDTETGPVEQ